MRLKPQMLRSIATHGTCTCTRARLLLLPEHLLQWQRQAPVLKGVATLAASAAADKRLTKATVLLLLGLAKLRVVVCCPWKEQKIRKV